MAKNLLAHMPVKMGVKKGGCYAGGLVPAPNSVGTLGVDGYNKMLANMKAGTFGNQPAAAPNALTDGIAQPAAPVAAAAAVAPVAAPVTPTPAAPPAPAKPAGLSISNGMDSGGGLQITNGFDSTPAPLANTQPAQTTTRLSSAQGYARGKVPSLTDGIIRGPGGPTDDKVDAKVSPKEAILPARTVQAIGGPAAVKDLIERTNGGKPPESEVMDNGKYAGGAVPGFFDDVRNALARPDTGLRQDANAIGRAVGDFSGVSRRMPDIPAEDQAAYAAQKPASAPLAAAAAPAAPDYGNEPNAPASTPAPLAAAARPAPAQAIARLPSPGANTQVGSYGAPAQIQQPSSYQQSPEQAKPERLATNGTSWEEGENARRRSFDNFVTRSDLQSGVRDAQRSGRRGEAAAAANALTSFNNQADAHEEKAGEFDRGMKALTEKTASDQAMEGIKSKNALAQVSLQGQNNLSITGQQGQNALATEALRGRNDLASRQYVNPLDAEGKRLSNQQAMAKLATEGTLQTLQSRMLSATDGNERQDIQDQIMALQGREPRNRFSTNVVHGVRTKNLDGSETATSPMAYTTDARTGQVTTRGIGESQAALPSVPDSAVLHLKANPKLASAFDAKYGKGASAAYLNGGR